jgi:SAM-dependent methyltransferase
LKKNLKILMASNFPTLSSALRYARNVSSWPLMLKSNKKVFSEIYLNGAWNDSESRSGRGSRMDRTVVLRAQLPGLIEQLQVKSILDAPCGDFNWMRDVQLNVDKYIGADIVEELILKNQNIYAGRNREFIVMDILKDRIPRSDLILCRDCLVHFSFHAIERALQNFRESGSVFLLATTFPELRANRDICTGDWRPINLQLPPFNFPEPLKLITENNREMKGTCSDKSLGLWKLSDINHLERDKRSPHLFLS